MSKSFKLMQAKGKCHKFPSFNLGGGAKLYKNLAQKLLAVSLCMAVVLLCTPVTTYIAAAEPVASGTCGDERVNDGKDVTWKLEKNGDKVTVEGVEKDAYTLTISGSGAMTETLYESWPWKDYRSAITEVMVEDGVTSLSGYAFQGCSALSTVSLPASVKTIGFAAFYGCYALTSITLAAGSTAFEVSNNGALLAGKDGTLVAYARMNSNEHLIVPAGVTEIPENFFNNATNVTSVSLPATVETIGWGAFTNMPKVGALVLPPSVTSVGQSVFGNMTSGSQLFYKSGFSLPAAVVDPNFTTTLAYTVEGTQDGKTAVKITSASKAATVCNNAMGPDYVITGTTAGNVTFQSGHTWDAANYECADCASAGSCEHDWDGGEITKDPTCTDKGEKKFTCTREGCGETKTEEVAALGHAWDDGKITKDPTCTEVGVKTYTCTREGCGATKTEEVAIDEDAHDLSDVVVSEPTAEKLGEVHSMCSRCDYDVFSHYTLKDGTSPTMYPDGSPISSTVRTPTAASTFDLNGQEIEILLQDPLDVFGSRATFDLGLTVRHIDLPATFDGDVEIEHSHSYDIIPTVNGVEKSGQLSNKVRLLHKIPQGWDRHDLEVFLAQAGEDREFDEVTEKIGDDEYLVVWTDHFSPYVFVDKLNPEEKAELETLQDADGSNGDSNSPQGDSGNGQSNGNNSAKTGDASGEILMLSTLAMIVTGLYLGLFLKKKKSF